MAISFERLGFSPRNFGTINEVHDLTYIIDVRQLRINWVRRSKTLNRLSIDVDPTGTNINPNIAY